MSRPRPALLFPALGLNLLIASGTFLVAKETLRQFPPLPLTLLRFVLATAMLWVIARVMVPGRTIAREDRPRILVLALLAVPLNQGLFLYGMQWASASHAALLYALTPAFALLFTAARSRTRPTLRQGIGIALAFAGVLTLMLQRGLHFDRHSVTGDVLILIAVVSWALYLSLGTEVTKRYGPLLVIKELFIAGTLMFLPVGLLGLRGFHPGAISAGGWSGLFYLAWLTSALAYVLWYWGLAYLPASTVALLTNLQPVVTVALAWVLLHEPLPAGFALSSALVLGGVWITQSAIGRPLEPAPAEIAP
jgi:drug/metabolite transporter (DMT)-like permease